MFEGFKRVCKNVKNIDGNTILKDIFSVTSLQQEIVDLNKDQMYNQGVDSLGKSLGEYAPVTITHYKPLAAKEGRDGRTDHVTLKNTGDFYDSIKVKNEKDQIVIKGDLEKIVTGPNIHPEDALGLTPQNLNKVAGWILPDYRDKVLQRIRR